MTNQEIATRLVSLLREGKFNDVYDELFHDDAEHMQENLAGAEGMEVGDAIIAKDYIAIPYKMTAILKDGNKWPLDEIIVYKIDNGKIISEQFFY